MFISQFILFFFQVIIIAIFVYFNFSRGEFIVAGSDDGSMFIWDRTTTNIEIVLRADESIVNCLQPHPSTCLLATSGIDPVVRLWSPRAEVNHTIYVVVLVNLLGFFLVLLQVVEIILVQ